MSTRYKGSILSSTAAASSSTAAYGLWKQSEVAQLIATAWPVIDPSWTSVSMLLHGDGTVGTQNNTFIDSSSNAFTITRNGTTTQGTVNPFGSIAPYSIAVDGGSAYFGGTPSSLSAPANAVYQFGTGDFTIECWINKPAAQSGTIIDARTTATAVPWVFGVDASNFPYFYDGTTYTSTVAITNNVWNHVAVVRTSGTLKIFVGGAQGYSAALAGALNATGTAKIGGTATYTIGYISNLRVVKGTAVYTAAFTPPTAPLTAISGTSLLLGFTNAGVIDNAMQNNLLTSGSAQISTGIFKYGTGSISFNGTNSYLNSNNTTTGAFGANNFTVEFWIFVNAIPGSSATIFDTRPASTNGAYTVIYLNSDATIRFFVSSADRITSSVISINTWYHVAVCRSSGSTKMFLNGTQTGGTYTDATTYLASNTLIGTGYGGGAALGLYLNGYIDDLRTTKGVARYTADFTAPQQAFPNQ